APQLHVEDLEPVAPRHAVGGVPQPRDLFSSRRNSAPEKQKVGTGPLSETPSNEPPLSITDLPPKGGRYGKRQRKLVASAFRRKARPPGRSPSRRRRARG